MERHLEGSRTQILSVTCVLLLAGMSALAQAPATPPPAQQAPAQSFAPQQLDNLVAPIALYPDPLLGQVLAATTYPVELVEAQQWLQANGNLHGQDLVNAAKQQSWDASIQALVAMPDVLGKLTQDIHWTTDLGNAFLAQPADVMAAVQRLRVRAEQNGKLQSNQEETVTTQTQNGQQAVEIQPADPQQMYVPQYDPGYVWGPPAYGAYPPLYYPYYGMGWYPPVNIGLFFGPWWGWGWGAGFGWGWGPNWFGGGLFINVGFFHHYGFGYGGVYAGRFGAGFAGRTAWAHDAAHRMGVGYPNSALNSRFGAASQAARISSARSGNYHSFGAPGAAGNSFRGSSYAGNGSGRSFGTPAGNGGYQHFQEGRQSYQAPAARSNSNGSAQRYSAPSTQHYSAPSTQHYSAPSTQHYSAPSSSGHSYSGGGGAAGHFSGGGGHSSGGGGGHGGRR